MRDLSPHAMQDCDFFPGWGSSGLTSTSILGTERYQTVPNGYQTPSYHPPTHATHTKSGNCKPHAPRTHGKITIQCTREGARDLMAVKTSKILHRQQ
jgi:hypothetical protein